MIVRAKNCTGKTILPGDALVTSRRRRRRVRIATSSTLFGTIAVAQEQIAPRQWGRFALLGVCDVTMDRVQGE